jgi:protein-S-isoprenylcysteine O-methyltransferase Ste14
MGLRRIICLLVALVGLLMVVYFPRLSLLGNLLVIIGTVLTLLLRKRLQQKFPSPPLRRIVAIQLIALGVLAIAVAVSMQFPENSSLGFWSGALVIWGGIGVAFWLVVRRGRRRSASGDSTKFNQ